MRPTDTAAALLAAIRDDPADDLPRLAYADWCEEQGDNDRAEFIRVQIELVRVEGLLCHQPGAVTGSWCDDTRCPKCGPAYGLYRRERELLARFAADDLAVKFGLPPHETLYVGGDGELLCPRLGLTMKLRRGFIAEVRLPLAAFLEHAGAIFSSHPVERVTLTDKEPGHGWHWYDGGWRLPEGLPHLPSDLPTALFDLLEGYGMASMQPMKRYEGGADAALAALSAACVKYGRAEAALKPTGGSQCNRQAR